MGLEEFFDTFSYIFAIFCMTMLGISLFPIVYFLFKYAFQ
jgi:hypothetical protein